MRLRTIGTIAIVLATLAAFGSPARAIVLHTDDEVPEGQRPHDSVIGSWRTNASCVVIGPSLVLTTTHQGGPYTVIVDGVTYDAISPAGYTGGMSGSDDIRVAELSVGGVPADLGYWVPLYTGDAIDEIVVLGGYGKGRGAELTTPGDQTYGYAWAPGSNTTLRWGQNRVEQQITDYVRAFFDGPDVVDPGVDYEAAVAEFDSGGGWFIEDDGVWHVAGLTVGAKHAIEGQSWFADSISGAPDPDNIDAIRVQYYADWITEKMDLSNPAPGDTDRDGDVDYDDLVMLAAGYGAMAGAGWSAGNFDGDGDVDLVDLGIMAAHYGDGAPAAMSFGDDLRGVTLIPEPASLTLLALAGAGLLRRRR